MLLEIREISMIFGGLAALRNTDLSQGVALDADGFEQEPTTISLDFELQFGDDSDAQAILHTLAPPELPPGLSPGQAAQLARGTCDGNGHLSWRAGGLYGAHRYPG